MSPKINFSSLVNLFKTPYAVQGQSPVEHGFQNGENKSGANSITSTIRKKPNEQSTADRRPSPDDSMTGQRELGTTSRTVGPESCRLSTFKPLVISTYMIRTGCLCIALPQIRDREELVFWCQSISINACKVWHQLPRELTQLQFHGNPQLTVTSVYAPTECSLLDDKDDFYNDLNNHLEQMKPHNIHLVVGDFNARVGLDSHSIHPEVNGRHCCYDTTNNNGERLVDCVKNSNFVLHKWDSPIRGIVSGHGCIHQDQHTS